MSRIIWIVGAVVLVIVLIYAFTGSDEPETTTAPAGTDAPADAGTTTADPVAPAD